jgi:hypothetical protein
MRDEEFDRYLDATTTVVIADMHIPASDALATDAIAYDTALQTWRQQRRDALLERVLDEFPQPIALRFHRYRKGSKNPRDKLSHLRDTWEALITMYAATILGEANSLGLTCASIGIDPRRLAFHNLRDAIDIITRFLDSSLELSITNFLRSPQRTRLYALMGVLNDERNGLAHKETPAEPECRTRLARCEPLVYEALGLLEPLADCIIASFVDVEEDVIFQVFRGKGTERELDPIQLSGTQKAAVLALDQPKNHVLALWQGRAFTLSPLVRWYDSGRGHQPLLAFLDSISTQMSSLRYQTYGTTDAFDTATSADAGFREQIGRHASKLIAEHERLRGLFRKDPRDNARDQARRAGNLEVPRPSRSRVTN